MKKKKRRVYLECGIHRRRDWSSFSSLRQPAVVRCLWESGRLLADTHPWRGRGMMKWQPSSCCWTTVPSIALVTIQTPPFFFLSTGICYKSKTCLSLSAMQKNKNDIWMMVIAWSIQTTLTHISIYTWNKILKINSATLESVLRPHTLWKKKEDNKCHLVNYERSKETKRGKVFSLAVIRPFFLATPTPLEQRHGSEKGKQWCVKICKSGETFPSTQVKWSAKETRPTRENGSWESMKMKV